MYDEIVAPYVGAWIETFSLFKDSFNVSVAPYVGAWIETCYRSKTDVIRLSHPTWVRGLKLFVQPADADNIGRTLRGCVD